MNVCGTVIGAIVKWRTEHMDEWGRTPVRCVMHPETFEELAREINEVASRMRDRGMVTSPGPVVKPKPQVNNQPYKGVFLGCDVYADASVPAGEVRIEPDPKANP